MRHVAYLEGTNSGTSCFSAAHYLSVDSPDTFAVFVEPVRVCPLSFLAPTICLPAPSTHLVGATGGGHDRLSFPPPGGLRNWIWRTVGGSWASRRGISSSGGASNPRPGEPMPHRVLASPRAFFMYWHTAGTRCRIAVWKQGLRHENIAN